MPVVQLYHHHMSGVATFVYYFSASASASCYWCCCDDRNHFQFRVDGNYSFGISCFVHAETQSLLQWVQLLQMMENTNVDPSVRDVIYLLTAQNTECALQCQVKAWSISTHWVNEVGSLHAADGTFMVFSEKLFVMLIPCSRSNWRRSSSVCEIRGHCLAADDWITTQCYTAMSECLGASGNSTSV